MAKMVVKSANKALELLIAKRKLIGSMPYDVFTQQFTGTTSNRL